MSFFSRKSSLHNKNSRYLRRWYYSQKNDNGNIFQITNMATGDSFIGCTTNSLKKRWWQILAAARAGDKGLLYDNIRIYGESVFVLDIIKECNHNDESKELLKHYISQFEPTLNSKI